MELLELENASSKDSNKMAPPRTRSSRNSEETLTDVSQKGVDKFLAHGKKKHDTASLPMSQSEPRGGNDVHVSDTRVTWNDLDANNCDTDTKSNQNDDEMNDSDWEDGSAPALDNQPDNCNKEISIEFNVSPDSGSQKKVRRATVEDKEVAELVHKAHLLCLLSRGRLIDKACDDPLIQASLLSLLPQIYFKISTISKLRAKDLVLIVSWFHKHFQVKSSGSAKSSFSSALANALQSQEGTPEELAALSVALFRAVKLTLNFFIVKNVYVSFRFVSILDVASLKPDVETYESPSHNASKVRKGIFSNPTMMVAKKVQSSLSPGKVSVHCDTSTKISIKKENLDCEAQAGVSDPCTVPGSKRKGDVEFQMQMEMALSSTAVAPCESDTEAEVVKGTSPFKKIKTIQESSSSSQGISTAVGSKKVGSPLYWAEVYCCGENLTGKWVHVDAINGLIDGEQKVEAALGAFKKSLRYAVAFAGYGAKDVTRRYCTKWHNIASKRVNSIWWDTVLAPLRHLESAGTGAEYCSSSSIANRNALEDMELETRALTEPLPTNQQAYKNHKLYALERWLTKYQILYPQGPVLGFCSGHAVYPRTCVQTLKSKFKWLPEGLQVKANEVPVKVLKHPSKQKKPQIIESEADEEDSKGDIELYGKWQLEPLFLPHAENGIVPKNDRGQVDVWSEKCLPPGTVHLRLPRIFAVAKRLQIDYAPAMVGFEFRNARATPVFEGIVVCQEFKEVILDAYAEEERIREAEEKRRNEAQALSRWYQLLSSIVTRQRLNNSYGDGLLSELSNDIPVTNDKLNARIEDDRQMPKCEQGHIKDTKLDSTSSLVETEDHEHVLLTQDESFDEESSIRTKRCHCGFSIQVEEF
ncbi:hypothetical protein ACFE04_005539 [Oxalis oulophora]